MRTNIDIDDALMKKAMKVSKLKSKTKKAVVEEALERMIRSEARAMLWDLAGKVEFEKDDDPKGQEKDKWAEGEKRHQAYLASEKQRTSSKSKKAA